MLIYCYSAPGDSAAMLADARQHSGHAHTDLNRACVLRGSEAAPAERVRCRLAEAGRPKGRRRCRLAEVAGRLGLTEAAEPAGRRLAVRGQEGDYFYHRHFYY